MVGAAGFESATPCPYDKWPFFDNAANSNSAALAVANRANRDGEVPLPGGGGLFDYAGATNWRLVEFGAFP